jgi:hypothetical protein
MLLSFLLAAAEAPQPIPVRVPEQPALTQAIAARDAEFFDLFFNGCDPERLATMVAPDMEFYHDKGGFNVRSGAQFVADYAKNCAERQKPGSWRSRRELVRSALHVDPIPGHGALEAGEHLFYERRTAGPGFEAVPEKPVGRARFAQLWVLGADGQWRISRVFSYAHGPAE